MTEAAAAGPVPSILVVGVLVSACGLLQAAQMLHNRAAAQAQDRETEARSAMLLTAVSRFVVLLALALASYTIFYYYGAPAIDEARGFDDAVAGT